MTHYLFTSFSFARFVCHWVWYSSVYRCVWVCSWERNRGREIKGSWQHFYKFRKQLHSLKPMNTELKDLTWVMKVSNKNPLTYSQTFTARPFEIIPNSSINHMVMAFIVGLTLTISEFLLTSKAECLWLNPDGCVWQVRRRREKNYWGQRRKKIIHWNLNLK